MPYELYILFQKSKANYNEVICEAVEDQFTKYK